MGFYEATIKVRFKKDEQWQEQKMAIDDFSDLEQSSVDFFVSRQLAEEKIVVADLSKDEYNVILNNGEEDIEYNATVMMRPIITSERVSNE